MFFFKKIKWLVTLMFIVVFSTIVLSACSDSDNESESASGSEGLSGEIEVWGWDIAAKSLEEGAERFMEEHPDTDIKVNEIGEEDLYDRLTVGLRANGSGVADIFILQNHVLDGFAENFPDQILNLSEMGFDEHEDEFVEFKSDAIKNEEGDFVAFPWDIGPAGVFYRTDYFDEAEIDVDDIKTWDDYIEAGEKIKSKLGKDMLSIRISEEDDINQILLNQLDSFYFDEDGKININSKEQEKALQLMQDMYQNEIVSNASDWDAQVSSIVNGEVATIPAGVWYSGTLLDQVPDQEGKWDVFELPEFEDSGSRAANQGGSVLAIPSSTDNPELAYAFGEFFTTDKELQIDIFKEYGLFPSLIETHDDPYFEEPSEYFNDSNIYKTFADISSEVSYANYTSNFANASDALIDAQTQSLLDGDSPKEVIKKAADRVESETGQEQVN